MSKKMKYKFKRSLYKFLSENTSAKTSEKFKEKFLKYDEKYNEEENKTNINLKLDNLQKEVEELKQIVVENAILGANLNPYVSQTLKENLKLEALCHPTATYIKSGIHQKVNDSYIKSQLDMLFWTSSLEGSYNKETFMNIVFDLLNKAGKENRVKIYDMVIERLYQYQHYSNFVDKLFDFAKEDINAGLHTPFLLSAYITRLLRIKNENEAEKYLEKYLDSYGKYGLTNFLPTGDLAYRKGVKEPDLKLISDLYHKFEESESENFFENYIKGKKVAIVGNGPQELNTGNGRIIDDYDEVIRFNNFSNDEKFIKDYGRKTTIWSKNGCVVKRDIPEVNINLTRLSLWHMQIGIKLEDYRYYLQNDKHFVYVPDRIWTELLEKYGIECATGGLQMIYWVKKVNPDFSLNDCFGFSFKQKDASQKDFIKHYFGSQTEGGHSFDREKYAVDQILS